MLYPDGVVLAVRLSKTIQFRERVHEVSLARIPGSLFCPVAVLEDMREMRGRLNCAVGDLVFQRWTHGAWAPLLKHTAVQVLDSQITAMGLNPAFYRYHAFRFGALQESVLAEPSLELIRLQSDHVSDAIHGYTHLLGFRRFMVSQKVGERLRTLFSR